MGLVAETFSGVYANANQATRRLSTAGYADLVSGSGFRTSELTQGRLTVFVQIPLKVLQATPGLGRVIIGALLNAAYESDGRVKGHIVFLLDEVARLGPMGVVEAARDAGRNHGLTLLLLSQSVGQLVEQWGKEGARAWYDSTSWRLYAALQDPENARELSQVCGEHGVLATARGDTECTHDRAGGFGSASSGRSENRSEIKRSLIKPDELLQDTRSDEAFVIMRGVRPLRYGRASSSVGPTWSRRSIPPDSSRRQPLSDAQPVCADRRQVRGRPSDSGTTSNTAALSYRHIDGLHRELCQAFALGSLLTLGMSGSGICPDWRLWPTL